MLYALSTDYLVDLLISQPDVAANIVVYLAAVGGLYQGIIIWGGDAEWYGISQQPTAWYMGRLFRDIRLTVDDNRQDAWAGMIADQMTVFADVLHTVSFGKSIVDDNPTLFRTESI